jgi:hypothetical protein
MLHGKLNYKEYAAFESHVYSHPLVALYASKISKCFNISAALCMLSERNKAPTVHILLYQNAHMSEYLDRVVNALMTLWSWGRSSSFCLEDQRFNSHADLDTDFVNRSKHSTGLGMWRMQISTVV